MSNDDTRSRLLEAAGPIFAEKGFRDATVREICQAADANLAAVNYYFGDKERLYIETIKQVHRRMRGESEEVADESIPPAERLRLFIAQMIRRIVDPGMENWTAQLLSREVINPTVACEELVHDSIRPQIDRLLAILDRFLPEETPLFKRYQMAFSIVGQCIYYRMARSIVHLVVPESMRESHFDSETLSRAIFDFSMAAIRSLQNESAVSPEANLKF